MPKIDTYTMPFVVWRHHYRWRASTLYSYTQQPRSLSSEGVLEYFDTRHPFITVISEVLWHSHLLPSVWKWSCHYLILRRRYVAAEIQTPNPTRRRQKLWTTVPTRRYVCCKMYILNACRWQISWNLPLATDSGEEFILCNDYSLLHFPNDPANILKDFYKTLSGIHRLRKAY